MNNKTTNQDVKQSCQDRQELAKNEASANRRKFIKDFGKLAVVTPVAVTVLMSTYSSKAMASTGSDDGIPI